MVPVVRIAHVIPLVDVAAVPAAPTVTYNPFEYTRAVRSFDV